MPQVTHQGPSQAWPQLPTLQGQEDSTHQGHSPHQLDLQVMCLILWQDGRLTELCVSGGIDIVEGF